MLFCKLLQGNFREKVQTVARSRLVMHAGAEFLPGDSHVALFA